MVVSLAAGHEIETCCLSEAVVVSAVLIMAIPRLQLSPSVSISTII